MPGYTFTYIAFTFVDTHTRVYIYRCINEYNGFTGYRRLYRMYANSFITFIQVYARTSRTKSLLERRTPWVILKNGCTRLPRRSV